MKGYKTIKNPTFNDMIDATVKLSYMATIVSSAQAAADEVGDAACLHDIYNTVDEVAANLYAAETEQPEGTYSSRLQEDGSLSEYPEDVKAARKRRNAEAAEAIDAKALEIWQNYRQNIERFYPYFAILDLTLNYANAHCFLGDAIGQEIDRIDAEADKDEDYMQGDPSANLVSWMAAFFLITHGDYFKTMLKEWKTYIKDWGDGKNKDYNPRFDGVEYGEYYNYMSEYVPTYDRLPEIKRDLIKMLDDYFALHLNSRLGKIEVEDIGEKKYYKGTFYAFVDQYDAPTLFVPNISEDTYRRYRGK